MAASPLPRPNHPGRLTRVCDQANTQGMARRSFRSTVAAPGRGLGSGVFASGRAWPAGSRSAGRRSRPSGLIRANHSANPSASTSPRNAARGGLSIRSAMPRYGRPRRPRSVPRPGARRGEQHRGADLLQVPLGDGLLAVPGEDHLALLGDLERPVDRTGRLGQHGPARRPAAPAQRAAAAVEQGQPHAVGRGPFGQPGLGVEQPQGGAGRAEFLGRVGVAEHRLQSACRWLPAARRPAGGPASRSSRRARWPGRPRSRTAAPRRAPGPAAALA